MSIHVVDPSVVLRRAERLPRYTSYPTANHFRPALSAEAYGAALEALPAGSDISLYLHIPFCDAMCWYCACSTKATKRYEPIAKYLDTLEAEIDAVAARLPADHKVTHIHWGGGSPDILVPDDIRRLGERLQAKFHIDDHAEFAIEVDPRLMTGEKANALVDIGVNRISVGVQDFDPRVQAAIGRIQGYGVTKGAIDLFRRRGVTSVNMDLVYGLPHQTEATLADTITQALSLQPDRIAIFGYAHLPQRAHNQRLINEMALPGALERYAMSNRLMEMLIDAGYVQRGIDHFALPEDGLATKALNRNFQGYTTDAAEVLVGLGASAIGKLPQGYFQNAVASGDYIQRVARDGLATAKGFMLEDDDRLRAFVIERLMCDFAFSADLVRGAFGAAADAVIEEAAKALAENEDGLLEATPDGFRLTPAGRPFVRSICARFDAYLAPEEGVVRHSIAV